MARVEVAGQATIIARVAVSTLEQRLQSTSFAPALGGLPVLLDMYFQWFTVLGSMLTSSWRHGFGCLYP
jgi:hypothetical protein